VLGVEQLRFLASGAGEALLEEAAALQGDFLARVTRLRKGHPADLATAALELLDLRARARRKFARADRLFFTPQGLEQSSGETISRWRAAQYPDGALTLDLCCGIGGDALSLGAVRPVLAVDRDPAAAFCAAANAHALGVSADVRVACADVTALRPRADAAFFDPSRRAEGRRVRSGEDYAPPLSFARDILRRVPSLAVKAAPSLDDAALEGLDGRIQFVSDRGECKEALIWFGDIGPTARKSAVLLPGDHVLEEDGSAFGEPAGPPLAWLYEPDPAVIRAHLLPEVGAILAARPMDDQIAYLTGEQLTHTPFVTAYRVLGHMPFSAKRLQAHLKAAGLRVTAIKRRGVPLDPIELGKRITGGGDTPVVVVLTRVGGAPTAILCEPPLTTPPPLG
jgi:hypothetical protein